jgi:hypothetical protein
MLFSSVTKAQDLETITQDNPFTVQGGISVNQVGYKSWGRNIARDPYTFIMNGNLDLGFLYWKLPLNFIVSNKETSFNQSFNRLSINPTYKWIRLHIGDANMSFSPYTLNGHSFRGIGAELNPGDNFTFSAMYGQLQKEVVLIDSSTSGGSPAFKRRGMGFKAGYKNQFMHVNLITFYATDIQKDFNQKHYLFEKTPKENMVNSITGGFSLLKGLQFNYEIANSWHFDKYTYNFNDSLYSKNTGLPLPGNRESGTSKMACNFNLQFNKDNYGFGIAYERVDPEYTTMGAYYFTNDFENYTANIHTSLLKNKLSIGANGGLQKNNLKNNQLNDTKRWVGSLNLGIVPGERLNISLNYSNFQTFTQVKYDLDDPSQYTPITQLDTLRFIQTSQNTSMNLNYQTVNTENSSHQFVCVVNHQLAESFQNGEATGSKSLLINTNFSYNMMFKERGLNLTGGINVNKNEVSNLDATTIGPMLSARKTLLDKKLRTGLTAALNQTMPGNEDYTTSIKSLRWNSSYSYKKNHSFALNMVFMQRSDTREEGIKFSEFVATLSYRYKFNMFDYIKWNGLKSFKKNEATENRSSGN